MKIGLISIKDFKRIRNVVIAPGSRAMILIAGMNKQGKTSLIGAITACLGGKGGEPDRPIRDGEDFSEIKIDLHNEEGELEYEVFKRFLRSGSSSLKLIGKDGKLSSPQKILDRIIGTRFLEPFKFLDLPPKQQLEALVKVVDIGINLEEWQEKRKRLFDARTDANRDLKRWRRDCEANPHPGEIPEAGASDLADKVADLSEKHMNHRSCEDAYRALKDEAIQKKEVIARLERSVERAMSEYEEICDRGRQTKEKLDGLPDVREELEAARTKLRVASHSEEDRTRKLAQLERHVVATQGYADTIIVQEKLSEDLKEWDEFKERKLAEAKMPVEGLSIEEKGLEYKRVPLSDASGSEQLSVALALASAMSPHLQDIWMKDGSLLDENSLKLVGDYAEANNLRVWLERVGESDEGAIILEDGVLKV